MSTIKIATLTTALRDNGSSIDVPRSTDASVIADLLDAGMIRRVAAASDDESRADRIYEVTEYGEDLVWGRIA